MSENKSKPIPGPRAWPFIGNVLSLDKVHMQRTLYDWMKEYGPVFKFSFLGQDVVTVNDPTLMREVFSELRERPILYQSKVNFNCSGASFSNYEGNQKFVKEITCKIYRETYQDPYIKQIQDEMLDEFINKLISQNGGVVDNVDDTFLSSIAAQFCTEATGGKPTPEVIEASLAFLYTGADLFSEGRPFILTMYPWLTRVPGTYKRILEKGANNIAQVVRVMFDEAKRSYRKGQEHGMIQNFMSRQEEENTKAGSIVITDDNLFASIITETILLAYAGTARNITVFFLYMLLNPEVLSKVSETIVEIRKTKRMEELVESDLPFLNAAIMECMRMSSIIFVTIPHHVERDMTIGGYQFKKGQIVTGCQFNAHLSEKTWGDPFQLRPERFLDSSGQLLPESHPLRQAFVPFGVGARYCTGKYTSMDKIFKYISRIMYKCEIQRVENKGLPSGDPRDFKSVVALQEPDFSCKFIERV